MFTKVTFLHARLAAVWLLCLCAFILSLPALAAGRGDWWMFQHDPQHTGRSSFNGPSVPLGKWKYTLSGLIDASPAIAADGTIYIGSWDNNVYALNPADGSLKWKFATGAQVDSSRPSARTGRSTSGHVIVMCMRLTRRMAR